MGRTTTISWSRSRRCSGPTICLPTSKSTASRSTTDTTTSWAGTRRSRGRLLCGTRTSTSCAPRPSSSWTSSSGTTTRSGSRQRRRCTTPTSIPSEASFHTGSRPHRPLASRLRHQQQGQRTRRVDRADGAGGVEAFGRACGGTYVAQSCGDSARSTPWVRGLCADRFVVGGCLMSVRALCLLGLARLPGRPRLLRGVPAHLFFVAEFFA
mmetsp:Transcript_6374/g.16083  ORF Transcript_6374/g.16083 Transcript_6374/m.16083 type:complete len:210 (+) Transcript_6374:859-1488(+)